ncbi:MAG: hypothetical protein HY321_20815 [Armatimonadetes bacterium]|nr:hypothetical protein [Armatimonadota bacterium]
MMYSIIVEPVDQGCAAVVVGWPQIRTTAATLEGACGSSAERRMRLGKMRGS